MHPRRRPLSSFTERALTDRVKAFADALDVSATHVYAILANTQPDAFANFRWLFRAMARITPHVAAEIIDDLRGVLEGERAQRRGAAAGTFDEANRKTVTELAEYLLATRCPDCSDADVVREAQGLIDALRFEIRARQLRMNDAEAAADRDGIIEHRARVG